MDDEQPRARRFALKPREIVPIDPVARTGDGTAISVKLIHRENELAAAKKALSLGESLPASGPLESLTPQTASSPGDDGPISVDGILRQNLRFERDKLPELIALPTRRRSRRRQDFLILLGGALSLAGALAFVFKQDRTVIGLALAGIAFVTLILTWILYGVMDSY